MRKLESSAARLGFALLLAGLSLMGCVRSADPPPSAPPAAVYGASPASPEAVSVTEPVPANASTPAAAALGTQTLAYPDDLQMVLLAHRLTGTVAPLEAWAGKAYSVTSADEFSRADALKTEMARLAAIEASTTDIGLLKLKTDGNFSEYDATRGGYYLLAFQPGSVYGFKAFDEQASLQFSNSDKAYLWPLDVATAQDVLKKAGSHAVDIDMTIALERAERRSSGVQITGRVVDYRVSSRTYRSTQLGEVVVR